MTSVSDFSDIELDASSQKGTFKVAQDFDVASKLDELMEKASKMKDYEIEK